MSKEYVYCRGAVKLYTLSQDTRAILQRIPDRRFKYIAFTKDGNQNWCNVVDVGEYSEELIFKWFASISEHDTLEDLLAAHLEDFL